MKNPITKPPEIEEVEKHQSKPKKKPTLCKDKRRGYFNCGICGSEDVISQGVYYCNKCGKEEIFLKEHSWWGLIRGFHRLCDCDNKFKNSHSVGKCVVCGAVKTNNCPSCKNDCWTSIVGEKYCQCGFRENKYVGK